MQGATVSFEFPVPSYGLHPPISSAPHLFVGTPSWPAEKGSPRDLSLDRNGMLSSASTTRSAKTMEETQDALWQNLSDYYERNKQTIERSVAIDLATQDNLSAVDNAINAFVETANVVLPGLVALANVHPAVGIAVFAFHGVISLDISRRDNNRKVVAVKLQMQNMMCAMFQLRKLRHIHLQEPERGEERNRLHDLIKAIADEIKICGSDLDYYMERKFLSKLINAKNYEQRFADHVETFARRRSELQSTVTAYIAASVDAANIAIGEVDDKLVVMDDKLNCILAFFRNLDTSREREARSFIQEHGGPERCIGHDELLTTLLKKADALPTTSSIGIPKGQDLAETRQLLLAELGEKLDGVLANNLRRFEKLLNVQNNNFQRIFDHMENQGYEMADHTSKLDRIVTTTISILEEEKHIRKATGPIVAITFNDPVIQSIWSQMGLKGSVRAQKFVLNLRDHFFNDPQSPAGTYMSPISHLYTPFSHTSKFFNTELPTPKSSPQEPSMDAMLAELTDKWVLEYVDGAHVQPIVEAIDEDNSGYISVKGANKFAISRPRGWSFLRWVGYWAVGYHINITNYRNKIYSTVQKMHKVLPSMHPANRAYVDQYLNHPAFNRLEALLRSITPLSDNSSNDSRMTDIADTMAGLVENRLTANLTEMSYVVESPATVSLVAGTGRVETWILPLLYLILTRHLKIIDLAQTHILHENELASHLKSLVSIFTVFDDRIRKLGSLFRAQQQHELKVQFEKFAYGMFLASFMETEKNPSLNTLLMFNDNKISLKDITEPSSNSGTPADTIRTSPDISILTMGLGPTFDFEEIDMKDDSEPRYSPPDPLEGIWTGECIRVNNTQIAFQGFFQCNIDEVIGGIMTGKGGAYLGAIEIDGLIRPDEDGDTTVLDVDFKILSKKYANLWCRGQYDSKTETIAEFPAEDNEDEEKRMDLRLPCGHFYITRTPASVFRFRRFLEGVDVPEFWTLARRKWAFAIESVRLQTQQRLGSLTLQRVQISERNTWIKNTIRRELDINSSATKSQLSEEGKEQLFKLKLQMHPSIGRLYESLALYLLRRMVYHVGPHNCYSCDRRIIFARYQCITCTDEKLSSQIDLCADCITVPLFSGKTDFAHDISHSLIRSIHCVHDCELVSVIPQARLRSERLKGLFEQLDMPKKLGESCAESGLADRPKAISSPSDPAFPTCACCDAIITLPCWVCVSCALDTYICLDCNLNRRLLLHNRRDSSAHSLHHPLLRINDSKEVKPAELKASRWERQLQDMEARINNSLSVLTQKVSSQLEMNTTMRDLAWNTAVSRTGASVPLTTPVAEVNAEMVSAEQMQDKISRRKTMSGALAAKRKKNAEQTPEDRLEQRFIALEKKVDQQLGQLMSLMQQLLPVGSSTS